MTTTVCATSIVATGSKAARRSPKATTAGLRSSPGRVPVTALNRRSPGRRRQKRLDFMKIMVVTDAWHPQVNGVVRTLGHVAREATSHGIELEFISPDQFRTLPMPSYPEIRLALATAGNIERRLER